MTETGILINKPKREKSKTVRTPKNIAAVAKSVCEALSTSIHHRSQQLNISETSLRRSLYKYLVMTSNWFKSWRQLTIQSIFASLSGPAVDWQKMPIVAKKNHLFRRSSFWSWQVCKQAKLSRLGHRKPVRIHWKADALKTCHCYGMDFGPKA